MEVASRISPICRNLECSASDACDDALSGSDHRAGVNISCPAPVNSVNNFWPAIRGDLQTFANINTDILQSPMTAFDFSSTIGPIQKSLYLLLLCQTFPIEIAVLVEGFSCFVRMDLLQLTNTCGLQGGKSFNFNANFNGKRLGVQDKSKK